MTDPAQRRIELCVGGVVVDEEHLLLIRRGHGPAAGEWSVPGGRVEPGETLAEAVLREMAEETGQPGLCGALMGWVEQIDESRHLVILNFSVSCLDPTEPRAGGDATEARWVPLDQVCELRLVPGLAQFLYENTVIDTIV